jgi:hypothetical protein
MAHSSDNIVVNTKPRGKKGAGEDVGTGNVSSEERRDGIMTSFW